MRRFALPALLCFSAILSAQQPPPPPVAIHALPFAVDPGKTTKLIVRGQRLEDVKSVRVQHPSATGKLIGNAKKVPVPNQVPASRLGDQEIEIELSVPLEVAGEFIPFALIGPGGESKPARVLVSDATPRIAEKEPNDSLRSAQSITLPIVVEGAIDRDRDIDVFQFDGKKDQTIEIELQAGRWGVPLDGLLTLFDADGRVLATDDDALAPDARLMVKLPRDGIYRVSLIDAHDLGGSSYRYRLRIR